MRRNIQTPEQRADSLKRRRERAAVKSKRDQLAMLHMQRRWTLEKIGAFCNLESCHTNGCPTPALCQSLNAISKTSLNTIDKLIEELSQSLGGMELAARGGTT
jgi:hypothetical protein